ncbi:MAG: NADH:ubiquinone reductase (Na(+)-transporting) subunit A, partial [Pseudomonadales bacterium]
MIRIKKGLDLPIAGRPEQVIEDARAVRRVAILGEDYPGMKPTMLIGVGDTVTRGQPLFSDKKNTGVVYTAPAAGKISTINRGAKRALLSVVIDVAGDACENFGAVGAEGVGQLDASAVREKLLASGLWTALRTRPFSKVPQRDSQPHSIFVTAMDSNPLAADADIIIAEYAVEYATGLDVLAKLTDGPLYMCQEAGKFLPTGTDPKISVEEFSGVHPVGLAGTHIH